jgi:hypothetical protein
MSTLRRAPDAGSKLRRALGTGGVAPGMLIAVGVAALFLALIGAGRVARPDAPGLLAHSAPRVNKRPQQNNTQTARKEQT